jgi:glutathione S-transferase
MKLVLCYAPMTCALVPYVTLTEAGAEFEARPVNFRKSQNKTPEYLKINPMHKVPVVMIDGQILTENIAIQIWIARNFPAAKLLPSDQMQEMKAISLMAWCASDIHPHLSRTNSPAKYCDTPGSESSIRHLAANLLSETFKIADDRLAGRDYFFGHFTAADAYFFWCFRRGMQFELPLSQFANCMAHFERMQQRPSIRKVLAYETEVRKEFAAT